MARPDPRALRAEAQDHVAKGRLRKAVEVYLALEAAEPGEGAHAHKVGELLAKLGDAGPAVMALVRAADKYARAGFLVKAIAVCKLILKLDPAHQQAQQQIAALSRERLGQPTTPPPLPRGASEAARALQAGRPLDQLALGDLAGGAAAAVAPGVTEIELPDDDLEIEEDEASGLSDAERTRVRAALRDTPFQAVLGEAALARLIDAARLIELGPGDLLFREGDPGDTLYVVESGEVVASVTTPAPRELGRLGEGAVFGEIALLTDQPRSATITAAAPTRLVAFDRKAVGDTLAAEPRATGVLVGFLRRRLVANLVGSSELFAPFSAEDRRALVGRFRLAEAEPGAVVVREGERARGLHLVLDGAVEVVRAASGDAAIATLAAGDVFGEIALLDGVAVATVRARARSLFLVLPAGEFREIMMTHPHVLEFVSNLADARKRALAAPGPGGEGEPGVDLHLDFL